VLYNFVLYVRFGVLPTTVLMKISGFRANPTRLCRNFLPTHQYTRRHIQEKIKPFMLGTLAIYFIRYYYIISVLYKEVLLQRDRGKGYERLQ